MGIQMKIPIHNTNNDVNSNTMALQITISTRMQRKLQTYNANATEPKKVEYSTPDGAVLKGTLRGGGNTMVILSHQNRASQKQWTFFYEAHVF